MGLEQMWKATCDLCGLSEVVPNADRTWITISIADRVFDRVWHEKAVCPKCQQKIFGAAKKNVVETNRSGGDAGE